MQPEHPFAGAHCHQLAHQGGRAVGQGNSLIVGRPFGQRSRQGFNEVLFDHFEFDPHRFGLGVHADSRGAGSTAGGRQLLELHQIIPTCLDQTL
ncbi:hypothetical protein D9M70_618700 [compost metagenome]